MSHRGCTGGPGSTESIFCIFDIQTAETIMCAYKITINGEQLPQYSVNKGTILMKMVQLVLLISYLWQAADLRRL